MTTNPVEFIHPLPVRRDSHGFWFHAGVPNFDEGEDEQYKAWLKNQGLVTSYKKLENEDDAHPVYDSYFEQGSGNISAWEPAPPAGDGWFTISIHDTEDGPVWVWARREVGDVSSDLLDNEAALLDDHAVDLVAKAMKGKLKFKRQQGFAGWSDLTQCTAERLAERLLGAVAKGDPIDVANYAMMLYCRQESHATLEAAYAAATTCGNANVGLWAELPAKCPITRRDFFMVIGHPELGMVPTYGGPYDSYTIPEMEGEPTDPFHERELFVRRYDHDRGGWVDDEGISMKVISDSALQELEEAAERPAQFDFTAHLARQSAWSLNTFGPGSRAAGVVDHIRKELNEIEADPSDLKEWIDVVILALDGAWRSGATPAEIIAALAAKQARNEGRTWPDWRTADPTKAIEHDRSGETTMEGGA